MADPVVVATIVGASATALLAALSLWQTILNGRQVKAIERQTSAQTDPFVVLSLTQLETGSPLFAIVLENIGRTPAFKLEFKISPLREQVGVSELRDLVQDFLNHSRPSLGPGQSASRILESKPVYAARSAGCAFDVTVRYSRTPDGKPTLYNLCRIEPYWHDGELLEPVGVWREVKSLHRKVDQRLQQLVKAIDASGKGAN